MLKKVLIPADHLIQVQRFHKSSSPANGRKLDGDTSLRVVLVFRVAMTKISQSVRGSGLGRKRRRSPGNLGPSRLFGALSRLLSEL